LRAEPALSPEPIPVVSTDEGGRGREKTLTVPPKQRKGPMSIFTKDEQDVSAAEYLERAVDDLDQARQQST
jgi:hypothetical protein